MKTKKIIKIGLIAVVLFAIIFMVVRFFSGLNDTGQTVIATTDFEKHIQKEVNEKIKGQDYETATTNYNAIIGEIQTQNSVLLKDGSANLSSEDASKCYEMSFYAYVPVFTDYAISYFDNPSWSNTDLTFFKNRSEAFLNSGFAESGSEMYNKLSNIISWIADYKNALKVIRSARHCTSVADVERIRSSVAKYKRKPLTNNASLSAGLNNAYSEAKDSYARHIINLCNSIAASYSSYISYDAWYNNYRRAGAMINGYTQKYGREDLFSSAINRLNEADNYAVSYFNNGN